MAEYITIMIINNKTPGMFLVLLAVTSVNSSFPQHKFRVNLRTVGVFVLVSLFHIVDHTYV